MRRPSLASKCFLLGTFVIFPLISVNIVKRLDIPAKLRQNCCMMLEAVPAKNILVLHGPNLNLLGSRESEVYGSDTLDEISESLCKLAKDAGANLVNFQSNSEAELVSRIQQAIGDKTDFIIINPAAYTHTSVAMRDALAAARLPFIEVHLSNIFARESFRRKSYFSDLALGVISGLGAKGYHLALEYALNAR